jgi:hypothetical protein
MCFVQRGLEVCVPRKRALLTDAVSVNIKIYLLKPWNEAEMEKKTHISLKKQLAK